MNWPLEDATEALTGDLYGIYARHFRVQYGRAADKTLLATGQTLANPNYALGKDSFASLEEVQTVCLDSSAKGADDCPPGWIMDATQSKGDCVRCPGGSYRKPLQPGCSACPAGTYSRVGAAECSLCPAGTYNNVIGAPDATFCEPCPAGQASGARAVPYTPSAHTVRGTLMRTRTRVELAQGTLLLQGTHRKKMTRTFLSCMCPRAHRCGRERVPHVPTGRVQRRRSLRDLPGGFVLPGWRGRVSVPRRHPTQDPGGRG